MANFFTVLIFGLLMLRAQAADSASDKAVKDCQSYEECYSKCVEGPRRISVKKSVGAVDCTHGLSDGVLSCAQVASIAASENFTFFAAELSGHGTDRIDESAGSFYKYSMSKKRLNHEKWIKNQKDGLIASRKGVSSEKLQVSACFSTGCAAILYNVMNGKTKPDGIFMMSPAIMLQGEGKMYTQGKCFAVSQFGAQPLLQKFKGGFVFKRKEDVSPKARLAEIDARSGCQVYQLTQLNREILEAEGKKNTTPIRIVAVKGDDTVDIENGVKRLKKKFSDVQVVYLEGGGHSTPAVWSEGPRGDFLGKKNRLCAGKSYLKGSKVKANNVKVEKAFKALLREVSGANKNNSKKSTSSSSDRR